MSNTIKKDDPRLTAFVLGELSAADTEQIQNAVSNSPELANAVEEIRNVVGLLGQAYQTESPLSLLDQQKSELARVASQESSEHQINGSSDELVAAKSAGSSEAGSSEVGSSSGSARSKKSRPWLPIAIAASLLGLLVGGAFYFDQAGNDQNVAAKMKQIEPLEKPAIQQMKIEADQRFATETDSFKVPSEDRKAVGSTELNESFDDVVAELEVEKSRSLKLERELKNELRDVNGGIRRRPELPSIDFPEYSTIPQTGRQSSERASEGQRQQVDRREGSGQEGGGQEGDGQWGGKQSGGQEGASRASKFREIARIRITDSGHQSSYGDENEGAMPEQTEGYFFGGQGFQAPNSAVPGSGSSSRGPQSQLRAWLQPGGGGRGKNVEGLESSKRDRGGVRNFNASDLDVPRASKKQSMGNGLWSAGKPVGGDAIVGSGPVPLQDLINSVDARAGGAGEPRSAPTKPELISPVNSGPGSSYRGAVIDAGAVAGDAVVSGEAPLQFKALGLDLVTKTRVETKTRTVPVQNTRTESTTRQIPVTRIRKENRTRMVNGKQETYQVEVPYTENVTQNYTVQVPYTDQATQSYQVQIPYTVISLPDGKADKLITELASGLDPAGKTEFKLEELIQRSAKTWGDAEELSKLKKASQMQNEFSDDQESLKNAENKPADQMTQARKLAVVLSKELADKSKADNKKAGFDVSDVVRALEKSLAKRNAEIRKTRTWKRVKAVPNTTRLMVGDKDELDLTGMQVNVQVDGFRARVLIDCFYYNDRASQLEGNFKLRLPDDASLYYFAFGESAYDLEPKGELADSEFLDDGTQFVSLGAPEIREARKDAWANVKEARMVPREKAAHAYRETVRRKVDPALVEWSGAGVFNARVFPLAPHKLHRIVIGYDVNLTQTDDGWTYQLDLPEEPGQCQVDLNIQPIAGVDYNVTPNSDPLQNVIKDKAHQRYRFNGKQENGVRVTANKSPQILLHSSDEDEGDFWGIQIKPDLPVEKVAGSPVGIFMVDTSLSSNPDKFNVWLEMLRATLTNNRDSLKHFNVLFFNVDGHFWKDGYVANTPENVEELMETCDTLALEGATDLYGALEQITNSDWAYKSPESSDSSRRPDLFLLSDGAATWGETNLRLIARQIADNNLGSLFAYQTGLTGTSIASLRFLAGQSGGAVFSVATEDEIKTASTAHRKRPWKLKSVTAAGATDTMTAGRVAWVYPGQSLTIVGRGELDGPIELELDQAANEKKISISLDEIEQVESELASRLYGQIAVGQLESLGAKVFDVAASYARHFRVTGDTCSLLMLESEADYERFDIKPQEDLFVIKSKVAKDLIADTLKKSADQLADPKAQTLAWLKRLETMPGMSFKMPTALKLAMDEIEIVAISKPLECSLTAKDDLSKAYLSALGAERLDYEKIATEANRRSGTSVDEAIKVYSSLVERNPGDIVIARDIAFTAMELDRPAQAYHLLRRVAQARPFQGSIYPALGQCLAQLGQSDMAIVYYEVALGGTFSRQGNEFKQIVSTEYMHLLRKITSGKLESSVPDFAAARLETMEKKAKFNSADVVITMLWNTDQTDVDLHVVEPSGEECSYENKRTRSNGQITSDIRSGFGPEMYFNAEAPKGKYEIKVKYFGNGQGRTELRNKVHLMIYRGYGTEDEKIDRRTVQLRTVGNKESVATIGIE